MSTQIRKSKPPRVKSHLKICFLSLGSSGNWRKSTRLRNHHYKPTASSLSNVISYGWSSNFQEVSKRKSRAAKSPSSQQRFSNHAPQSSAKRTVWLVFAFTNPSFHHKSSRFSRNHRRASLRCNRFQWSSHACNCQRKISPWKNFKGKCPIGILNDRKT